MNDIYIMYFEKKHQSTACTHLIAHIESNELKKKKNEEEH